MLDGRHSRGAKNQCREGAFGFVSPLLSPSLLSPPLSPFFPSSHCGWALWLAKAGTAAAANAHDQQACYEFAVLHAGKPWTERGASQAGRRRGVSTHCVCHLNIGSRALAFCDSPVLTVAAYARGDAAVASWCADAPFPLPPENDDASPSSPSHWHASWFTKKPPRLCPAAKVRAVSTQYCERNAARNSNTKSMSARPRAQFACCRRRSTASFAHPSSRRFCRIPWTR